MDRWADRLTDKRKNELIDSQWMRWTNKKTDVKTERDMDGLTDRETDGQMDRQMDGWINKRKRNMNTDK
jgi:hypothetical protein